MLRWPMRECQIRQTAVEVLAQAQAAAIAGIGLRGGGARDAMARARTEFARKQARRRWEAIAKSAWKTRLEVPPIDQGIDQGASR